MAKLDTVAATISKAEDSFNKSIVAASRVQAGGQIAQGALSVLRASADDLYRAQLVVWQDAYNKAPNKSDFTRAVPMPQPVTIGVQRSGQSVTGLGIEPLTAIVVGVIVIGVVLTAYLVTNAINAEASNESNVTSIAAGATTERYRMYLNDMASRFSTCMRTNDFEYCNESIQIAEAPIQEMPDFSKKFPWWAHAIIWPSLAAGVLGFGYVFFVRKQQQYRFKQMRNWFGG